MQKKLLRSGANTRITEAGAMQSLNPANHAEYFNPERLLLTKGFGCAVCAARPAGAAWAMPQDCENCAKDQSGFTAS